jgi:dTDP-4-amino-4,6-dideoxygalactose transaminase
MKPKIWLSSPHMGGIEKDFVAEAFETNWIAPVGPNIDGFENDLINFTACKSAVALSSGTAAIHLGLIILGVKPGDEVLCQSFTFAATANPIIYLGAKPIFVDSEKETGNMDPKLLEKAIIDRLNAGITPKVIIPVHLYGMPAKIEEISEIGAQYGIPVLEDAAESLGASVHGKMTGTFGDLGVLSFNGNKIITTSGGGALISNDDTLIKKAKFLSTQARDEAPHYQHSQIGYNYRMSNISAGIGRGQMQVLNERINLRRRNYEFYKKELGALPGISFLEEPSGYFCNRWLTVIQIDPALSGGLTREDLRLALWEENIESRPLWKPMHLQPIFSDCLVFENGVSEMLFDRGLCLPSGSNLDMADLERVVDKIKVKFL